MSQIDMIKAVHICSVTEASADTDSLTRWDLPNRKQRLERTEQGVVPFKIEHTRAVLHDPPQPKPPALHTSKHPPSNVGLSLTSAKEEGFAQCNKKDTAILT